MLRVEVTYSFKDPFSFHNKVLPYIYGGGMFFQEVHLDYTNDTKTSSRIRTIVETETLSQLITCTTGMLRFSPDVVLEHVKPLKVEKKQFVHASKKDCPFLGVIIKPSLTFKPDVSMKLIVAAAKAGADFVKDDDASEYTQVQSQKIETLAGGISYFQKVAREEQVIGSRVMVVPWVDGWPLLERMSAKVVTMSHCANLSLQVSWQAHILFSRLAGASFVIVADPLFDALFNLKIALETATYPIEHVPPTRIILSGGINTERIRMIMPRIPKEYYAHLGFAVGSWILSHSDDFEKNILLLKKELKKS